MGRHRDTRQTRGHQTDKQTQRHQIDTRTLGKLGHGNTQMHSDTSDTLNIWTFNLSNLDTGTLRLFLQWGTVTQTRNVLPKISMKFFTDRKHFLKTSSNLLRGLFARPWTGAELTAATPDRLCIVCAGEILQ